MTEQPDKPAEPVERDATGRFLPGNSGLKGGRPPGVDFRRIVEEHLRADGGTVEQAVVRAFLRLQAIGDTGGQAGVMANREILVRLCADAEQRVKVEHGGEIRTGPQLTELPPNLDEWLLNLVRVRSELSKNGTNGSHNGNGRAH